MNNELIGHKAALEREYGGTATFIGTEPVTGMWQGKIAWQGVVSIYALTGTAQFKTAYAWSAHADGSDTRRIYTALKVSPINTPWDAVISAIAADNIPKA